MIKMNREQIFELIGSKPEGQSVGAFCKDNGVTEAFFYYWRRKMNNLNNLETAPWGDFIPVHVKESNIRGAVLASVDILGKAVIHSYLWCSNNPFFGSVKCAAGSAIMFSLIQSCKLNNVNVLEWITDVLGRIATHPKDQLADLLPHKWKPVE